MADKIDKKARHESRVTAIKTIFAFMARESEIPLADCYAHVLDVGGLKSDDFSKRLISVVEQDLSKIKLLIRTYASDFSMKKISAMNWAILTVGMTEMKYFDTPPIVVINEYIELAKDFGETKSASFVNGVLDTYRKTIGKEREQTIEVSESNNS